MKVISIFLLILFNSCSSNNFFSLSKETCEELKNTYIEIYCEYDSRSALIRGPDMSRIYWNEYFACQGVNLEVYNSYTTTDLESLASALMPKLKSCYN